MHKSKRIENVDEYSIKYLLTMGNMAGDIVNSGEMIGCFPSG